MLGIDLRALDDTLETSGIGKLRTPSRIIVLEKAVGLKSCLSSDRVVLKFREQIYEIIHRSFFNVP